MASKANVVMGEAPESDSEDELNISDGVAMPNPSAIKGRVIDGEAPESDDETLGRSGSLNSISSAMSASSLPVGREKKGTTHRKDVSLLTKKLCERNVSLAKNVSELVSNTVGSANNELHTVDQHLLTCQVKVQEASNILKTLLSNVDDLDTKLRSLLSTSYIPDIQVPVSPSNQGSQPAG